MDQKDLIINNLSQLVETTVVNESLLSSLRANAVFSDEDVETIESAGTNSGKASKFYSILRKRKNPLQHLRKALENSNQTGALEILTTAISTNEQVQLASAKNSLKYISEVDFDPNDPIDKTTAEVFKGIFGAQQAAVKRYTLASDYGILYQQPDVYEKLNKLEHTNIIRHLHFAPVMDNIFIYIATELCSRTLREIVNCKDMAIDKLNILRQTTSGLQFIHKLGFIHRNLNPDNILLVERETVTVKISGFGSLLSVISDDRHTAQHKKFQFKFQEGWTAPEILQYYVNDNVDVQKLFSSGVAESDVFSLGSLYFYVLTNGKHPFGIGIRAPANILDNNICITASDIQSTNPDNILLVLQMIQNNPKFRPQIEFLLSHFSFWPKDKSSDFIRVLLSLEDSNCCKQGWKRVNKMAQKFGMSSKNSWSWADNCCPGVKRIVINGKYDVKSVQGLLKLLRQKKLGSCPDLNSCDEEICVNYLYNHFPCIFTICWIVFQDYKQYDVLKRFYCLDYDFDLEAVTEALKFMKNKGLCKEFTSTLRYKKVNNKKIGKTGKN